MILLSFLLVAGTLLAPINGVSLAGPNPVPTGQPATAAEMCLQNREKDLYADTTDCHFYFQCFYYNETFATGIRRECAKGTFWHDRVLSCMPEGEVPCQDRCLEDAVSAKGCYAGTGCRQFFICSNTASYGMCCPEGSRFNESTCGCSFDETCTDPCVQPSPAIPTTVAPSQQVNATVCIDSFGSIISTVPGEMNAYYQLDQMGQPTEKMYCPETVAFDLATCRCNLDSGAVLPPQKPRRLATIWLPFDMNTMDHSVNKFTTFLGGGAQLDRSTAAEQGGGSLGLNQGALSIPGLNSFDLRNAASFCTMFKGTTGGILSNYKSESEFTIVMGLQSSNTFMARLNFWHLAGTQTVKGTFTPTASGWNHVCVTYDGNAIRLYLNGAEVDTQFTAGYLAIASSAYIIGQDQTLGYFIGNIDNFLITSFAMTKEEVEAHRTNNIALLNDYGFGLGEQAPPPLPIIPRPSRYSQPTGAAIAKFGGGRQQGSFFVIPQLMTWTNAMLQCQANNAQLATVLTPAELASARSVMASASQFSRFWVGAQAKGDWLWLDGTLVEPGFWKPSEPINDCCLLDVNGFNVQLLGTDLCGASRTSICEWNTPKQYQFVALTNSWGGARTACQSQFRNGRLAVLQSEADVLAAANALQRTGVTMAWVGCSRNPVGRWQWWNNVPIDKNLWQPGTPSGAGQCGLFFNGVLWNANCNDMNAVVCKT